MREFWDERARENAYYFVDNRLAYQDPNAEWFWTEGEMGLERVLGEMDLTVQSSDTVVDIGCGVGRMSRALASRAGRVIAVDVSEEMLERARELNAEQPNIEWLLGDGTSLAGIDDESADGCFSVVVFQHIPDPAITLGYIREIGRVLRPGGWAAIQVSDDPSVHRTARIPLQTRLLSLLGRAPRGQDHPAWLGSAVNLEELRTAAEQAGLKVEATWGAGTLFCRLRLRKRAAG